MNAPFAGQGAGKNTAVATTGRLLPFRLLALVLLLPPLLYLGAMLLLQSWLENALQNEAWDAFLGDTQSLLSGAVDLPQAVERNLDGLLAQPRWQRSWLQAGLSVRTRDGKSIYPAAPEVLDADDPMIVAAENLRLMELGFELRARVAIPTESGPSMVLLVGCLAVGLTVLYGGYRRALRHSGFDERRRQEELGRLREQGEQQRERLLALQGEKGELEQEIGRLKQGAERNEEQMLAEVLELEQRLQEKDRLQTELRQQIGELTVRIGSFDAAEKPPRVRPKAVEEARKRFETLYGRLVFHERAIEGFAGLTGELRLKAERVIQQLDQDPAQVPVKRKVFGKKSRETVFEILYHRKGRLYYRHLKSGRIEILAVGTKNTQERELEFLENL